MISLTTGQLARKARVNVETIRYYERRGLVPAPPRRDSGYRQFSTDAVQRIRFIKRAQQLGFSLDEIEELLALRADGGSPCAEVRKQAEVKVADVEERIRSLKRIRNALRELIAACAEYGSTGECPILTVISRPDEVDADR